MNGRLLGVLACLLALPWSAPVAYCPRGTLTGEVTYVRDGDTIELGEMSIRLSGLAAPEWDEPGGAEARKAMTELVRGRIVQCELDGTRPLRPLSRNLLSRWRGRRRGDGSSWCRPGLPRYCRRR